MHVLQTQHVAQHGEVRGAEQGYQIGKLVTDAVDVGGEGMRPEGGRERPRSRRRDGEKGGGAGGEGKKEKGDGEKRTSV